MLGRAKHDVREFKLKLRKHYREFSKNFSTPPPSTRFSQAANRLHKGWTVAIEPPREYSRRFSNSPANILRCCTTSNTRINYSLIPVFNSLLES